MSELFSIETIIIKKIINRVIICIIYKVLGDYPQPTQMLLTV